jgi:DNA polymerase III subunit gamma/tau
MPKATDDGLMLTEAYRPYHLDDIIGQDKTKKLVGSWLRTGRVPRSILISGQTSAGKTTSARILGRAMLCVNLKDGRACGECKACKSFDAGNHPDYIEIDAASDRGIDAMRALSQRVVMRPLFGNKKVVVLDECHAITPQGWAAMLKTLEEPPPHVVFVLLTTNPEKLPQTIVGRCSALKLQAVSVEDCTELLISVAQKKGLSKAGLQKDHLVRIAKVTGSHPRNALHALEQVYTMVLDAQQAGQTIDAAVVNGFIQQVAVADVETIAGAIIRGILEGKPGGALKRAEDARAEADILLGKLTEMLRQAMLLSTNPKLMDAYYKEVFEGVGLFAFTVASNPLHIEARQVVLDAYACFTRLRIETSNHQVPVGEVIGEPIARASLLCQKFIKSQAPSPNAGVST